MCDNPGCHGVAHHIVLFLSQHFGVERIIKGNQGIHFQIVGDRFSYINFEQ